MLRTRLSGDVRTLGMIAAMLLISMFGLGKSASADTLSANQQIDCFGGGVLYSDSGEYDLACQYTSWLSGSDLVFWTYIGPGGPTSEWDSLEDETKAPNGAGTHHDQTVSVSSNGHLSMQGDGNFVLYNADFSTAGWATNTAGQNGAYLTAQDDGNLVVYDSSGSGMLWSVYP